MIHIAICDDSKQERQILAALFKFRLILHLYKCFTKHLITYPTTQTHADVPEEIRIKNGITDSVLRLSAGIEDKKDLIADLKQAIDSFQG